MTEVLVVLDDDPTGTQGVAGVDVVLDCDAEPEVEGDVVHVETSSRALPPEGARGAVARAAGYARSRWPGCRIVLRGDSTLRGHVLEEYDALCGVVGGAPPLLLVPALPSARRVTVDGTQWLVDPARGRVALHDTEFARDGAFSYDDARVATWADARSGGRFPAAAATEIPLARLRASGGAAVADAIADAGDRTVVVADAESDGDVALVAAGVRLAWDRELEVVVRCAPALAAELTQRRAHRLVTPPPVDDVLVVAGSFVSGTTRQLERLEAERPGTLVEADLERLVSSDGGEVARLVAAATERLADRRLAVVATPRARRDLDAGAAWEAAETLARVAGSVAAGAVVAKGGVTSAVTARGLGAASARVEGPLLPGVSLWTARTPTGDRPFVVVPGNVGDDDLLLDVVSLLGA
ncbi:MAG TPA: four-carbon acid sugar kinase family protein [Gaiellaceae bacterium]